METMDLIILPECTQATLSRLNILAQTPLQCGGYSRVRCLIPDDGVSLEGVIGPAPEEFPLPDGSLLGVFA